jgi:hypothetical protein
MADAWTDCQARLARTAPDVTACWRVFDWSRAGLVALRRELRPRVHEGDAPRILAQQEAVADELAAILDALPDAALRAPGGEEDWNVAQAFAHTTAARRFLVAWAAQDVDGAYPGSEPRVTPSIPGAPDATREELHVLLEKSRRSMERSAEAIAGHETERCGMAHPLVGHLRHGEWLAFVGIHDLMHLEQLHRLAAAHG